MDVESGVAKLSQVFPSFCQVLPHLTSPPVNGRGEKIQDMSPHASALRNAHQSNRINSGRIGSCLTRTVVAAKIAFASAGAALGKPISYAPVGNSCEGTRIT